MYFHAISSGVAAWNKYQRAWYGLSFFQCIFFLLLTERDEVKRTIGVLVFYVFPNHVLAQKKIWEELGSTLC